MRYRRSLAQTRLRIRMPTAMARVLPDFLVLGTMRGGTSSLYRYLSSHPDVVPSLRKETEYFTWEHGRGDHWYRAHFTLSTRAATHRVRTGRQLLAFEATPYYLIHPDAPVRASALLPSAQLVVLLREPVARAYSHYQHMVRLGFERLPFDEAIDKEASRITSGDKANHRFSYLARGRYAEQIERWLDHFPRSQMLVLASEDLYTRPADAYSELLDFLGLERRFPSDFANASAIPGGRPAKLDPALRATLLAYFEPHNERLARLLGHDMPWPRSEPVYT
jgi:hypothetical protein